MEAWRKEKAKWLIENAIPKGECLICHLAPNAKGYCPISFGRKIKERAHRVVFFADNPEQDRSLMVLHSCDTRNCINPKHLFLGTSQDNTDDMVNKGRAKFVQPRTDHAHRDRILQLRAEGLSKHEIAQRLYISPSTVWNYISPRGPYYVGD